MEEKPEIPQTLDGENETLRKYLPADVAPENYSKLKLTRAQLKSIGIKRKEPPSEKQKLRNAAAANRFREMHQKKKSRQTCRGSGTSKRIRDKNQHQNR